MDCASLLSVFRQVRAHLWHRGPVDSGLQQDLNPGPSTLVCLRQALWSTELGLPSTQQVRSANLKSTLQPWNCLKFSDDCGYSIIYKKMISTVLYPFAEWAALPYFLFILAHYIFWPPSSSPYNTWVFFKKNYGVRWTPYFLCESGISMIPGRINFSFFISFQCCWGIHKVSGIPQRASYHCQWCDWLDLFCCLVYQFLSSSHT